MAEAPIEVETVSGGISREGSSGQLTKNPAGSPSSVWPGDRFYLIGSPESKVIMHAGLFQFTVDPGTDLRKRVARQSLRGKLWQLQ